METPPPNGPSPAQPRHEADGRELGIAPETTKWSLIHWAVGYDGKKWHRNLAVYLATITCTYGLMALVAVSDTPPGKLQIYQDWPVVFAFLISFPAILFLVASDQQALNLAVNTVWAAGVLTPGEEGVDEFKKRWGAWFTKFNLLVQVVALVAALFLADFTADSFEKLPGNSWAQATSLNTDAYQAGITLFYALLMTYIARCAAMALLLKNVADNWNIALIPLHPDGCGGLQPLGRIGLRNQYALMILGINIAVVAAALHSIDPSLELTIVVPALAVYLIFGPIIFLGPLLPFRRVMAVQRRQMIQEIAAPLDAKFDRIKEQACLNGAVSKQDFEALERLRAIGKTVGELPIWPFDARTMRVFATAYVTPVLLAVVTKVGEVVFDHLTS